jgi:hypothetical protein
MGGGKEDRHEPGLEHWSLAVKDGKALENQWQSEIPIPRGGPHRYVRVYFVSFACDCQNDTCLSQEMIVHISVLTLILLVLCIGTGNCHHWQSFR